MPYAVKKDAVASRKIGDEYLLLTTADSTLHNVTGVGVRIMELLEAGTGDEEEILKTLTAEFDADEATLRADLATFLAELAAKGILERVT